MKLRDHPLMSYRGLRNWPLVWVAKDLKSTQRLSGEVGVLKDVRMYDLSFKRIFLTIEYDKQLYIGCLFLDNFGFCQTVYNKLKNCVGWTIEEIAEMDMADH